MLPAIMPAVVSRDVWMPAAMMPAAKPAAIVPADVAPAALVLPAVFRCRGGCCRGSAGVQRQSEAMGRLFLEHFLFT